MWRVYTYSSTQLACRDWILVQHTYVCDSTILTYTQHISEVVRNKRQSIYVLHSIYCLGRKEYLEITFAQIIRDVCIVHDFMCSVGQTLCISYWYQKNALHHLDWCINKCCFNLQIKKRKYIKSTQNKFPWKFNLYHISTSVKKIHNFLQYEIKRKKLISMTCNVPKYKIVAILSVSKMYL